MKDTIPQIDGDGLCAYLRRRSADGNAPYIFSESEVWEEIRQALLHGCLYLTGLNLLKPKLPIEDLLTQENVSTNWPREPVDISNFPDCRFRCNGHFFEGLTIEQRGEHRNLYLWQDLYGDEPEIVKLWPLLSGEEREQLIDQRRHAKAEERGKKLEGMENPPSQRKYWDLIQAITYVQYRDHEAVDLRHAQSRSYWLPLSDLTGFGLPEYSNFKWARQRTFEAIVNGRITPIVDGKPYPHPLHFEDGSVSFGNPIRNEDYSVGLAAGDERSLSGRRFRLLAEEVMQRFTAGIAPQLQAHESLQKAGRKKTMESKNSDVSDLFEQMLGRSEVVFSHGGQTQAAKQIARKTGYKVNSVAGQIRARYNEAKRDPKREKKENS